MMWVGRRKTPQRRLRRGAAGIGQGTGTKHTQQGGQVAQAAPQGTWHPRGGYSTWGIQSGGAHRGLHHAHGQSNRRNSYRPSLGGWLEGGSPA